MRSGLLLRTLNLSAVRSLSSGIRALPEILNAKCVSSSNEVTIKYDPVSARPVGYVKDCNGLIQKIPPKNINGIPEKDLYSLKKATAFVKDASVVAHSNGSKIELYITPKPKVSIQDHITEVDITPDIKARFEKVMKSHNANINPYDSPSDYDLFVRSCLESVLEDEILGPYFKEMDKMVKENNQPIIHIKNSPSLSSLPNDSGGNNYQKNNFTTEAWISILSTFVGKVLGLEHERDGQMIHNMTPVAAFAKTKTSQSYQEPLDFHTELAFLPYPLDFLVLSCLRADKEGVCLTALAINSDIIKSLEPEYRKILEEKNYLIYPSESFGKSIEKFVPSYRSLIDPDGRIFLSANAKVMPRDDIAADAYLHLLDASEKNRSGIAMKKGDTLVLNNGTLLHGRSVFPMHKMEKDNRLLQRTYVIGPDNELLKKSLMPPNCVGVFISNNYSKCRNVDEKRRNYSTATTALPPGQEWSFFEQFLKNNYFCEESRIIKLLLEDFLYQTIEKNDVISDNNLIQYLSLIKKEIIDNNSNKAFTPDFWLEFNDSIIDFLQKISSKDSSSHFQEEKNSKLISSSLETIKEIFTIKTQIKTEEVRNMRNPVNNISELIDQKYDSTRDKEIIMKVNFLLNYFNKPSPTIRNGIIQSPLLKKDSSRAC